MLQHPPCHTSTGANKHVFTEPTKHPGRVTQCKNSDNVRRANVRDRTGKESAASGKAGDGAIRRLDEARVYEPRRAVRQAYTEVFACSRQHSHGRMLGKWGHGVGAREWGRKQNGAPIGGANPVPQSRGVGHETRHCAPGAMQEPERVNRPFAPTVYAEVEVRRCGARVAG